MAQANSNPFTIQVVAQAAALAAFQLSSSTGGTLVPFTLGHVFRKGQVSAGARVVTSVPTAQVIPKNYWPDGSLKFAVVSGRASLNAGVPLSVALSIGTPASANSLTTADLRATGAAAVIGAGIFGNASWSVSDWDNPFMSWVSGAQMSSWLFRKPIGNDPHLVGWLEVRLYAGGALEILPWIENGYIKVAGPTSKSATYTFTLNGSQRFSAAIDLPNHCRTVLLSGSAHSHWLGSATVPVIKHDRAYLQSTGLVPNYRAAVSGAATAWPTLATSYQPLQQGNYANTMGQAGYQPSIGLLPEWDVLYLTSDDPRAYAGVVVNAYSAGRYPTHFRDETTNKPLRFSAYPNLVTYGEASSGISGAGASTKNQFTPATTGTEPATWDTPHHPSLGFMAYLLTGRCYFMEEVQFAATLNFLKNTDSVRQFGAGILQTTAGANTERGAAWALRTLAHAACVTPDDDVTLRNEFLFSLTANVEFYHAIYAAQPNNPQGFVAPYGTYTPGSGTVTDAIWQQDFFTAVTGYMIALDTGIPQSTAAKLSAFFAWKAKSIIGRLGGTSSGEYLYRDAAVYYMPLAPSETPDFMTGKGPWYSSWGDVYKATLGTAKPGTAGGLRGGNFPEATSYWGNLQPAIAYAVEQNVPGAQAAYARMVGAPNWSELTSAFNRDPVWSVAPRGY